MSEKCPRKTKVYRPRSETPGLRDFEINALKSEHTHRQKESGKLLSQSKASFFTFLFQSCYTTWLKHPLQCHPDKPKGSKKPLVR